jgi:hypothetical protein
MAASNKHNSREAWLKAATDELRLHFAQANYPLPERIRFAIALTSSGRNVESRPGETWHSSVSADDTWEIIVRADKADPVEVLGILVHQLVHTVLPVEAGHGKLYKKAMGPLGLQGPARYAVPTPLLTHRLGEIAASLGPLPHASLDIERGPRPVARPIGAEKKQKTKMAKAHCDALGDDGEPCGYAVRISSKWISLGPPGCPKHGPMTVDPLPKDDDSDAKDGAEKPETSGLHGAPSEQPQEAAAG